MRAWIRKHKATIGWVAILSDIPLFIEWSGALSSLLPPPYLSWSQGIVDEWQDVTQPIRGRAFLAGIVALILAGLGWIGLRDLRMYKHFRRSRPVDVSHLLLTPPSEIRHVIDQLKGLGFKRLGEDRSTRPDFKKQITTWILVDRQGTTAAEVGIAPEPGQVICGFITVFSDDAVLITGHAFGEEHWSEGFVMQTVPSGPEDAWQRHQKALAAMASRHGAAQRLRNMANVLQHSATIRAKLIDHLHTRDLWMLAGWVVGAMIVWGAIAITGAVHFRSGMTDAAVNAWLAGLCWPIIIGMLVASLPTMYNLPRLIRRRP